MSPFRPPSLCLLYLRQMKSALAPIFCGRLGASKVIAVNDDDVVKYGKCIHVWEGQALVYLERHAPDIPAS